MYKNILAVIITGNEAVSLFHVEPFYSSCHIFILPELGSVRDYVISHPVSSFIFFFFFLKGSLYPHTVTYFHKTWIQ